MKKKRKAVNKLQRDLRKAMLQTEQTYEAIAVSVGSTKSHIWDVFNGAACNPTLKLFGKLVKHFNLDANNYC